MTHSQQLETALTLLGTEQMEKPAAAKMMGLLGKLLGKSQPAISNAVTKVGPSSLELAEAAQRKLHGLDDSWRMMFHKRPTPNHSTYSFGKGELGEPGFQVHPTAKVVDGPPPHQMELPLSMFSRRPPRVPTPRQVPLSDGGLR